MTQDDDVEKRKCAALLHWGALVNEAMRLRNATSLKVKLDELFYEFYDGWDPR